MRAFQKDVDNVGASFKKLGPQIDASLKGKEAGMKFGSNFSASATSVITASFDSLGQTLGSIIGTAVAPGIGTAVGSMIGSAVDTAVSKVSGVIVPIIKQGIDLNKEVRKTIIEFKTFTGSEQQAIKYLEDLKKLSIDAGQDFGWVLDTSEKVQDLTGNLELTNKILRAATEQAADFGGEAETITKVAEALGLMAEKGEIASTELRKLFKLGIDARRLLSQATGLSEKRIEELQKAGRLRGDVAARLISEGILREKGGFAKQLTDAERQAERGQTLIQMRSMEATQTVSKTINEMWGEFNRVMASEGAKGFTEFVDQTAKKLIDLTKTGIQAGINVSSGFAEGLSSNPVLKTVGESISDLSDYVVTGFKNWWDAKSPSEVAKLEIGVPIGQGIGLGIPLGVESVMPAIHGQVFGMIKGGLLGGIGPGMARGQLESLMGMPQVQALLETIRIHEGGRPGRIVGTNKDVADLSMHPFATPAHAAALGIKPYRYFDKQKNKWRSSTASGNYQITKSTWDEFAPMLGLTDFSVQSQQMVALALMIQSGGLPAMLSGNLGGMIGAARKRWTSVPGSTIGGGGQTALGVWSNTFKQQLAAISGGAHLPGAGAWSAGTDIPDTIGGARSIFGKGAVPVVVVGSYGGAGTGGGWDQGEAQEQIVDLGAAIAETTYATKDLIEVDHKRQEQLVKMGRIVPRAVQGLSRAEAVHAQTAIQLTDNYQEAARKQLVVGVSFISKMAGAIGQIAGMAPTQQVGKKRGLFSKILGVAAPFLNFIPVVGPILSAAAGIASSAIAGDYAGAITGAAGGFASGGVFRRGAPISNSLPANRGVDPISLLPGTLPFPRARGGPVYAGGRYVVGEDGWEIFTPTRNGYITPHAQSAGEMGSIALAAAELRAAVQHLNAMPANQVVMRGARGLVRAMDHDAGLIRLVSQRQRLA